MQLKTILNRVHKHKSFVYGASRLVETGDKPILEVEIRPRVGNCGVCSGCGRPRPGYDRLPLRRFEFVPLWGMKTFLLYAPRRVSCPDCGIKVEQMPWAAGKSPLTVAYAWFLAGWARRLSWKEVATVFHTSWDNVFNAVEMAVAWGRAHRDLSHIQSIGVDEIAWQRGHHYLTLVYPIDSSCKRLLWIGKDRRVKTLLRFFRWFGKERSQCLRFVCSDMWQPYLKVIAKKAGQAIHVLDRFHIMAHMSKAIDEIRAQEAHELKAQGEEPVLTKTRWLLLKRPDHLSEKQTSRLAELLRHNLKTVRGYLLKEEFQRFWDCPSVESARGFLDEWCTRALRSKLGPMKRVAKMLRHHRDRILNGFRAKGRFSSSVVEGFNTKAKLTTRKAFGFRTSYALEIALYHALGNLPEPSVTHRFF